MVAQPMAPAPRPFVDTSVVAMVVFGGSRLAYGGGRHGFEVVVGRVRGQGRRIPRVGRKAS
eukprot:scaffold84090_cov46-Cyclotella_meneghiniana.AAC.1